MKKTLLAFLLLPVLSQAQIVTTFAGNGANMYWGGGGYSGDGGPASAAALDNPNSVAADRWGNIYIADEYNLRIRKVDTAGIIRTVAGDGNEGWAHTGDGGPAILAHLQDPTGVAVDKYGNIYIAEQYGQDVRKVDTAGIITTLAGTGTEGNSGDGGPATDALLYYPVCVAADDAGNVYVSQWGGSVVRKIGTDGIISTVAGTNWGGYNGDGIPANTAQLYGPDALAFNRSGNLCITDPGNSRIRMVNDAGIISTIAGNGNNTFSGDGGLATTASLSAATGLAFDTSGNMYIVSDYRVRIVRPNGIIRTIAGSGSYQDVGDGGPALAAGFGNPNSIAIDPAGNMYVTEPESNLVRKITAIPPTPPAFSCTVYPNPFRSSVTIAGTVLITSISITDLLGQEIFKTTCSDYHVQLNLALLPAAMYFVRVNNTEVIKLVKAKTL